MLAIFLHFMAGISSSALPHKRGVNVACQSSYLPILSTTVRLTLMFIDGQCNVDRARLICLPFCQVGALRGGCRAHFASNFRAELSGIVPELDGYVWLVSGQLCTFVHFLPHVLVSCHVIVSELRKVGCKVGKSCPAALHAQPWSMACMCPVRSARPPTQPTGCKGPAWILCSVLDRAGRCNL